MDTEQIFNLLNEHSCEHSGNSRFHEIPNCERATGAFKECLIFPDMDYVLKVPFSFYKNSREEGNACEDEIRTYQSAKEAGVEKVFLETWFIGYIANGRPVYGQAKADYTAGALPGNKITKYERITKTVTGNMQSRVVRGMYDHDVNRLWVEMFISLYGKNFARKFEAWTKETHLIDMHSGNIGYRNDKPIILDYNYCR